jgi:DNA-directed RNA polymerase specialized sigma24 family protein
LQRASPKTQQDWLAELPSRDEAIVAAHRYSHMRLSEIARALGLPVSRVSRIVAERSQASARLDGADR